MRCNILEPPPNTGNTNMQLLMLLKNKYGINLMTYGRTSEPESTAKPPDSRTTWAAHGNAHSANGKSVSSLQAQLDSRSTAPR